MRVLRMAVGLVALGAGVTGTWWFLSDGEAARLRAERDRLERQRQELQQVVERLTSRQRVAEVLVTGQREDPQTGITHTDLQFIEFDRDGHTLPPRTFTLPGRVIYFDGLVIKFSEEHVTAGDPLRGRSIMLFRRIFSEIVAPKDGPPIDANDDVPDVFRVNPKPSEFEQGLWRRFWSYVTDPEAANQQGIRVAHGEAVYAPMSPGQRWTLTLASNGGLSLGLTGSATRPGIDIRPIGNPHPE